MNEALISKLSWLVDENPDIVHFGMPADAKSEEWIRCAEKALEMKFPPEYIWFLQNYVGGEIGGEEIYSIYGLPFDSINGGDVVAQHLRNRTSNIYSEKFLIVSETDFGEVFFFDYNERESGFPIMLLLPNKQITRYASDFIEFLIKRIESHIG